MGNTLEELVVPATRTDREHAIRGSFSFFAAATLYYMAVEYGEYALQGHKAAIPISVLCLGLALMETHKVGRRTEKVLKLR